MLEELCTEKVKTQNVKFDFKKAASILLPVTKAASNTKTRISTGPVEICLGPTLPTVRLGDRVTQTESCSIVIIANFLHSRHRDRAVA